MGQSPDDRRCRVCEYFDGGGKTKDGNPVEFHGDCLNTAAPRFQTTADDTCPAFFPDTTSAEMSVFSPIP